MSLAIFAVLILEIGSHFLPRLSWTAVLLCYISHCSWDDRCMSPCPPFFCWDGVQTFFFVWLIWNSNPQDLSLPSRSGTHHCAQLLIEVVSH
jgi:hypothetical protein